MPDGPRVADRGGLDDALAQQVRLVVAGPYGEVDLPVRSGQQEHEQRAAKGAAAKNRRVLFGLEASTEGMFFDGGVSPRTGVCKRLHSKQHIPHGAATSRSRSRARSTINLVT